MALTIGTDSYASVDAFQQRATDYGRNIPTDTSALEVLLRRACEQMQGMRWKGSKADPSQPLAWPRRDVSVDGQILPATLIPSQIEYGQMALAAELYWLDLNPVSEQKGAVIEETVGPLTVKYDSAGKSVTLASPERPSAIQFQLYLATQTFLRAIRA